MNPLSFFPSTCYPSSKSIHTYLLHTTVSKEITPVTERKEDSLSRRGKTTHTNSHPALPFPSLPRSKKNTSRKSKSILHFISFSLRIRFFMARACQGTIISAIRNLCFRRWGFFTAPCRCTIVVGGILLCISFFAYGVVFIHACVRTYTYAGDCGSCWKGCSRVEREEASKGADHLRGREGI